MTNEQKKINEYEFYYYYYYKFVNFHFLEMFLILLFIDLRINYLSLFTRILSLN